MHCPFCGSNIKDGALRCRYCKENLNTSQPPVRNKRRLIYFIAASLGVLLLVVFAISLTFRETKAPTVVENNLRPAAIENPNIAVIRGKSVPYEIRYNNQKWFLSDKNDDTDFEYSFTYKDSKAIAGVIPVKTLMPLEMVKNLALKRAQNISPDSNIIFEQKKNIHGKETLILKIECNITETDSKSGENSIKTMIIYGYYYSGKEGVIEFVTFTEKNLFPKYEKDITELLNGFEIYESPIGTSQAKDTPVEPQAVADVESSIVNIVCPHVDGKFSIDSELGSSGTGSIIVETGIVLTNAHIFPQKNGYLAVHPEGCFVTIPEKGTGQPKEIYLAQPVHVKELSENFDLAFLNIYNVYTDNIGVKYGSFPRKFKSILDLGTCEDPKIGDRLTIYGYPGLAGGYTLTVTDGLISTFTKNGFILTSAKISGGNSGGVALGKNGCLLGVPTMVIIGEYENFGVIIPMNFVFEFIKQFYENSETLKPTESACGAHSYPSGDGKCNCEIGYKWASSDPNSFDCIEGVKCGANMFLGNDGLCHCNPGYAPNLTKPNCIKVPANAHAVKSTTDVWLCNPGYVEVGNQCLKQ